MAPEIFRYSDYRTYLADFYRREKEQGRSFSYRSFALRAGLSSPNYLKLVIDGKRPVTQKNIGAFLRGTKLAGPAAEYFRALVAIEEGGDEREKISLVDRLLRLRLKHSGDPLQVDKDRWDILRSWHHWAVRELVVLRDFRADPAWISLRLGKKISAAQAKESLELLLRLEFLRKGKGGRLVQSEPLITTSDEISNLVIRHLHRQFIELGLISLFHDPVSSREMNGLSVALRENEVPLFKKMLKEFRRELNRQFSSAEKIDADHVYHFQTMFFPVTSVKQEAK